LRVIHGRDARATLSNCIKEVWTDMRPLSLRRKMEEMEAERGT